MMRGVIKYIKCIGTVALQSLLTLRYLAAGIQTGLMSINNIDIGAALKNQHHIGG
jgi:hypothetical protein